jgi:lipopolysaccharide transport system ATP-binding protein
MAPVAVRVERISKLYRRGGPASAPPTLKETLSAGASRLLGGGRRIRGSDDATTPCDFWALREVSFEVRKGEALGIIGSNGAGKSTLLKVLSRIVEPTSGRAEVHGRIGSLIEVGTGFHPELTGRENIFLNGAILGMRRAETAARFDEIVDFAGIAPLIDTPVKRYSSGQWLRLAFSVAAHVEPEILIIDEVLAVGDAAFQQKCMGKVDRIARGGRTVLFVSHQLSAVQKLCTRALLINAGSVVAEGPTRGVISTYLRTIEARSSQDLAVRTERSGTGANRIERIEVSCGPELRPDVLITGWPARFVFHTAREPGPSDCSFTIYNEAGDAVTSFDTGIHALHDRVGDGRTTSFRCDIPALPLRPGRYWVDAAITAPGGALEDHVAGAAFFDVQPGVFNGRTVSTEAAGYGSVEILHRWSRP